MAPKIFLTGVTGYIGGDAFYELYRAHPDFDYTLLVRNEERGRLVAEKYPKVRLVYGTLEDAEVFETEAAAADIVIHTADSADTAPAAEAIARGLEAGHPSDDKPGYWIHVSGTGILQWYDIENKRYGEPPLPEQKYDDIDDIERITNLPDSAPHRDVDKIVLAAAEKPGIRTAIVGPPTIYGPGRGPGNTRSIQVPGMAKFILRNGFAPVVGRGLAEWDNVHVHDLSELFVKLVDAALDPEVSQNTEVFGPQAYYFACAGVHLWRDLARRLADAAYRQGFVAEARVEPADVATLLASEGSANASFALNSKGVGRRAATYLHWHPHHPSLEDEAPNELAAEAKRLGIEPTGKKHEA